MADKLIDDVNKGVQDVKGLTPEALKELDQVLNELTKIAKKDHLSAVQSPKDRRKKIEKVLERYLKQLGGTAT